MSFVIPEKASDVVWPLGKNRYQEQMPGEFLQQFTRVIGKDQQDVLVCHYEE